MRAPLLAMVAVTSLLGVTSVLAVDSSRPPTKAGGSAAPPASGTTLPGGGSSTSAPGGSGGGQGPGLFADVVGQTMPRLYCRTGEPCEVVVEFTNAGAPVATTQGIPDPGWAVDGQPATPASVQRTGSGQGWATQEVKKWTARFTLPTGDHTVRATLARFPTEKEDGNNAATRPVTVGQPDMALKVEKDNVDLNTRYEVKVEIANKGTVPTRALSMMAVMIVNVTHTSPPPTPTQCLGNPNLSGCVVERHHVDSLAPGQKKRWKIGGKQLMSTTVRVHAEVTCKDPGPCADANPDNNTASKTYGP